MRPRHTSGSTCSDRFGFSGTYKGEVKKVASMAMWEERLPTWRGNGTVVKVKITHLLRALQSDNDNKEEHSLPITSRTSKGNAKSLPVRNLQTMDTSNRNAADPERENRPEASRKKSLVVKLRTPDLLPLYGQIVANLTNQTSSLKKRVARLEQENQRLASTINELNKAETVWTETVLNRIAKLKMENDGLKLRNRTLEEDVKRLAGREEALQHNPETLLLHLKKKLESEHAQRDQMHDAVVAQLKSEVEVERARKEEYKETMKRFKKALEGQI